MSKPSVEQIIEEEYKTWLNYLIKKYGPMPEGGEQHLCILKDTFEAAFDIGWKTCIARSYETYED